MHCVNFDRNMHTVLESNFGRKCKSDLGLEVINIYTAPLFDHNHKRVLLIYPDFNGFLKFEWTFLFTEDITTVDLFGNN